MDDLRAAFRPLVDHPAEEPPPIPTVAARARHQRRRRRRRRTTVAAGALALVAAVAGLANATTGGEASRLTTADDPAAPATATPTTPSSTAGPEGSVGPAATAPEAPDPPAPPTTAPAPPTPAPPTSAVPPLPTGPHDPFGGIEAEAADDRAGTAVVELAGGRRAVGNAGAGDWLLYREVDFGGDLSPRVEVVAASGRDGGAGTVEIRLDDVASPPFATVTVTGTGGWEDFTTLAAATAAIGGTHDLYVTFAAPAGAAEADRDIANLDRIRFLRP